MARPRLVSGIKIRNLVPTLLAPLCYGFTSIPSLPRYAVVRTSRVSPSSLPASAIVRNDKDPSTLAGAITSATSSSTGEGLWNGTLTFPSCNDLLELGPGDCILSETVPVSAASGQQHTFRIKLYPRGAKDVFSTTSTVTANGNKSMTKEKGGFGMAYRLLPLLPLGSTKEERVGVFLQYLPDAANDSVDATFSLRLRGNQVEGDRKFDIEWRSGMRFVSLEQSKLALGQANDFGAHLLPTKLLPTFAGDDPLQLQVGIALHKTAPDSSNMHQDKRTSLGFGSLKFDDIRTTSSSSPDHQHDPQVHVGRIVVPILQKLSQRPKMFQQGAYPGVEYRIMRIADPDTDADLFYSRPGADYELKPIYPLVKELERPWPIRIKERDIPKLYTAAMYNTISALGSLATAMSGLLLAFMWSQAVSLFVIPSLSMDPTLQVGDVLLVDKVTPRLLPQLNHRPGSVVLFHPPTNLQEILERNGGDRLSDRDLFVKRVAAESGDELVISKSGSVFVNGQDVSTGRRDLCSTEPLRLIEQYIKPHDNEHPLLVPPNQVAVLGDCGSVSIDSRVWGTLPVEDIVGRPILQLWPLARFGAVPDLPPPSNTASSQ